MKKLKIKECGKISSTNRIVYKIWILGDMSV